jgi:predicted acylesterase/phospholipase RssA
MKSLGIALSGGGSRAAAFHRGTIRALHDLRLLKEVDVVSTVSGGSVFGAAWICSELAGETTEQFLSRLRLVLGRGFIRPAVFSLGALKALAARLYANATAGRRLQRGALSWTRAQ